MIWALFVSWFAFDWLGVAYVPPGADPIPVFDAPNEGATLPVVDRWPGD